MEQNLDEPLQALAWDICNAERLPVPVDAEVMAQLEHALHQGILQKDEQGLMFVDEQSMVTAAALHILRMEQARLLSEPTACFNRLYEIAAIDIGAENAVSGRILSMLHNSGLLDAYAWGRQAIDAGVPVFEVLQVMENAVSLFDHASAESIQDFFAGHYEQVKNDRAGGMLYAKLSAWFAQHLVVATNLKHLHEAKPQECSASIYGCALHGLILQDFALGFSLTLNAVRYTDAIIAGPALNILGVVDYNNAAAGREAVKQVIQHCTQVMRTANHPLVGTAVKVLGRFVMLEEKTVVELLDEAGKTGNIEVLYALSDMLWREQKTLGERKWFWALVMLLAMVKAEYSGILSNIDMILMRCIEDTARQSRVLEFLNAWIAEQPGETLREAGLEKYFSSTFHRLVKQPLLLNKTLTGWFLMDDRRYPLIAKNAISHLRVAGVTSLALDSSLTGALKPNEIRFLLRRILGYVVGDEIQIRLVFSLVYTQDAKKRTFPLIANVLRDQVGYDFPYQTIKFLKERQDEPKEPDDVKALCGDIVAVLQEKLDAQKALPHLKEFYPTSSKVHRLAKERRKQMDIAMEEANKGSVLRLIVSTVHLKAGHRSFQSINGQYTEPMELKSISHFIAIPLSEIADPAGASRERFLFRAANRDTP